jgi:ribonuclease Z
MNRIITALAAVCVLALSWAGPATAQNSAKQFKVTLLGTGTPPPFMHRFGPAILIQAGGRNLLFDSGRGVTQRLFQLKIPLGKIDHVFLTHLHSDHVVGIPDLWLTGWLGAPWARRRHPFAITGPAGTVGLMKGLEIAYAWDIKTRTIDQKLPAIGIQVKATDMTEGVVYENSGIKVTAFKVFHAKLIDPAYGYRIDFDGRTVILSGDTRYTENLVKNAKGADLIIHSVAVIGAKLLKKSKIMRNILAHHSEPEDTAKVFNAIKPKLAIYSHVVMYGGLKPKDILSRVRAKYSGAVRMGKDLMAINVGRGKVTVEK